MRRAVGKKSRIVTGFHWAWSRSFCSNANGPERSVRVTIVRDASRSSSLPIIASCGALLSQKPDMTLKELREAVELKCSLPAIHYALEEMGLTYKKRHSELANKTARTSRGRAERGVGDNSLGIPPDSSSLTSRVRRPI